MIFTVPVRFPDIDFKALYRGCPKAFKLFNQTRQRFDLPALSRSDIQIRPKSKRWRPLKFRRARDILETAAYQAPGFRGKVRRARDGRESYTRSAVESEALWIAANSQVISYLGEAWSAWQNLELQTILRATPFTTPEPRIPEPTVMRRFFKDLAFPTGDIRERFLTALGDAEEYPLGHVDRVLNEFGRLEFQWAVCGCCGGPNTKAGSSRGFPVQLSPCFACTRHGKPRTTLPKRPRSVFDFSPKAFRVNNSALTRVFSILTRGGRPICRLR